MFKKYNRIKICNDYAVVYATNTNQEIIIDTKDVELVSPYAWSINQDGYAKGRVNGSTVLMHRFLMKPRKTEQIDHRDREKLNNRRYNLNIVNSRQQQQNRNIHKNNKSGCSGVSYNKADKAWKVSIYIDGVRKHLGSFKNKEDAVKIRKEYEDKYYYKGV